MNSIVSGPWVGFVQAVLALLGTWLTAFGLKSLREAGGFDTSKPNPQSWRFWVGLVMLTLAVIPSLLLPFTPPAPSQERTNSQTSGESRTLTPAEEFERKSRCIGYRDQVKKEFKDRSDGEELSEIFYSPKLNTCVAVCSIMGANFPIFEMRDVLSGKRIYFDSGSYPDVAGTQKKFEEKVAELKKSN